MKVRWSEIELKFGPNIHVGKVGKWKVFYAQWNTCRSLGDPPGNEWTLSTKLPGIKETLHYPSLQSAKGAAKAIIKKWLEGLD